jgi:parallel beta-helix repeat protein
MDTPKSTITLPNATSPTNSKGHSFPTVQAAIDNMDVAGWIYVPPGTYTEAVDIIGKNNLMLFGAGWGMTKITYGGDDHTLDIDNSDDVIIRDIRIDQTSTGNTVNAIRLDDAQRCKIQNVYIGDSDDNGISFVDVASEDCEIVGCYITGADGTGVYDDDLSVNLKIRGITIKSCFSGIYSLSDRILIENNLIESNIEEGIRVGYGDSNVVGNQCIKNGKDGIIVDGAAGNYIIIIGNICKSNSWGNSNSYDGIFVDALNEASVIISNNVCWDDHSGCSGNGCQRHGICLEDSKYSAINGNACRGNLVDGIKIHGRSGNLVDYNTLNGNVCEGNGGRGIYIFGDKGSGNDYANKNIVVGNQLFDNTGTNLDDDGTNTEIGHNITA